MEEELRRANDRQGLLLRLANALLVSERPSALLGDLFDELVEQMGADAYFNYVAEDEGGKKRLRLDSCAGISDEVARRYEWLDYGSAVCGTVAGDERKMVLEAVQERTDDMTALIRELGITAYVCHPLVAHGTLVGTLSFGLRGKSAFDAEDLELLQAVADQVASAVHKDRSRRAERMARRAAEEANRAKTDFMATMSHELRTPLSAIIGYAELLTEGVPEPIPPAAKRQVERIGYAARHLQELIGELLTFSRLEAGRESAEEGDLSIPDLVDEIRAVIEPMARESDFEFVVRTDDAPATVHTDSRKLRQILVNLLGNAVKFTDRGKVALLIRARDGDTLFQVADTGPGIEPDDRERLFEPFWQSANARSAGGTGLGLTISRRYAEILGGELSVESTPEEGSVFTLRLPPRARGDRRSDGGGSPGRR